ncbi:MAG: hypothetical protein LBI13_03755, partial [Streptococcaceae bacterium]|nr:hypothetical protein [Streptococcaceae bacterium]
VKGGNIGSPQNPIIVIASTGDTQESKNTFEQNGLQASVVNVDGQVTVVFRGSEALTTNFGQQNYDWAQDVGFNDPYGYEKGNSQIKDAAAWIASEQQPGGALYGVDMSQVTFTGHSLGGGLASWAAVHYEGTGVVFSAPSTYNMLTPEERARLSQARVTNYRQWDDVVANAPKGVPRIGKQVFVAGNGRNSDIGTGIIAFFAGLYGHDHQGFVVKDGKLVRDNQIIDKLLNNADANASLGGLLEQGGEFIASIQKDWGNLKNFVEGSANAGGDFLKILYDNAIGANASAFVNNAIDNLNDIKKENDKILDSLNDAYFQNQEATYNNWCWILSYDDVASEMINRNLQVSAHVDENKVSEVSQKINREIEELQKFSSLIDRVIASAQATDHEQAQKFSGGW